MASANPKWSIDADFLQACNCDYGCPCEFEAPPTTGFCEGIGAYRINKGKFNDVSLDGLGMVFAIKFPGAMHKGNGTAQWIIDERANPHQRAAIRSIVSGEAGGMPFEMLKIIFSKIMPPIFSPIQFKLNGRNSSVQAGAYLSAAVEPIKNPVTGENEDIRIEHGTGFVFKSADCVSASKNQLKTPAITFSHPNKAGFVTKIQYSNG